VGAREERHFELEGSTYEQEKRLFELEMWRCVDVEPQSEPACRQNEDGTPLCEEEMWRFSIDLRLFELEMCPDVLSETTFKLARCPIEEEVCLSERAESVTALVASQGLYACVSGESTK
jgi:hypothetical protein